MTKKKSLGKLITPQRGAIDIYDWTDGRLYELGKGTSGNEVYERSPWAYACMHLRATELANLPWYIEKNGKRLQRHKLYDMLQDFGPENNWNYAVVQTEIDLDIHGAAFWYRDYDEVRRINPATIEVKRNTSGIYAFWQYREGEVVNKYNRDEITYLREHNPYDDLDKGIAVMEIVSGPINTEYEAEKMIRAYFENDAVPGIMLTTEQAVPEPETKRIRDWFNKNFRGSTKTGKVAVADKGLSPVKVSNNFEESKLIEIRDQARNDICVGFRVPKILVGSMSDATYANAQEARKYMLEDLIVPRSRVLAEFINQDLIQKVDPQARFVFAPEELPILQENENEKHSRLKEAVEMGSISVEYYNEQMGYPITAMPENEEALPRKQWATKALKAFKRGEGADVAFETNLIPIEKQYVIRGRLMNAKSDADVLGAFR